MVLSYPSFRKGKQMSNIVKKQVCKCENCGNEAEMEITCSLPDEQAKPSTKTVDANTKSTEPKKIKGTATCKHCGNEADMWIDY
jgi:DNA-directed RNA polymerase subunit M/transcription elongation factor TFIIS